VRRADRVRSGVKGSLLAIAVALAAPDALLAQDEWPRDTSFDGPMRFCSPYFAVDVPAGEKVTVRDPGLDFTITYFEEGDRWLGLYEGNHPQTTDKQIRRVRLLPGVRVDRMADPKGAISYLVHALPDSALPGYVHIFSDQFTGAKEDRQILQRFVFGGAEETGCAERTYARS
jgi:hypothetical protein